MFREQDEAVDAPARNLFSPSFLGGANLLARVPPTFLSAGSPNLKHFSLVVDGRAYQT
jgi:hypothetical protein